MKVIIGRHLLFSGEKQNDPNETSISEIRSSSKMREKKPKKFISERPTM